VELAVRGRPLHSRSLEIEVAQAEAGRWQARGAILDLRRSSFVAVGGDLQPAGLVHHMRVAARLDPASRMIEEIRASQPSVAFEPSELSRGESCRDPAANLEALAGTQLDPEYPQRLNQAIGGPRGCSHVLTLARLVASTLQRALYLEAKTGGRARRLGERIFHRCLSFDGLQPAPERLELAIQLADLHFAPAPAVARPMQRFAGEVEVRGRAEVELASLSLAGLELAERTRNLEDLERARWREHTRELAELVGQPLIGGMGRRLLALFGADPERAPLLDALLHLAPAFQQCLAIISEHSVHEAVRDPTLVVSGGISDSCYMWRREGALASVRREERAGQEGPEPEPAAGAAGEARRRFVERSLKRKSGDGA
jgi:hypothetical protein